MELRLPRYATRVSERMLLQPNLLSRQSYVPSDLEKRKFPIVRSYEYFDEDSIVYKLPQGYVLDVAPKSVDLHTSFGNFTARFEARGVDELLYTRRLEFSTTSSPPDAYPEYRDFLRQIAQADKASCALTKKK